MSQASSKVPGICLVGCGWWGGVHALQLKKLGGRIRRYFASRDISRAREFADRFDGDGAFAGIEEAVHDSRVDAVLLALPHHLHASATRAALAAGKHVLVEKPLALHVDEARQLVRQAAETGCCLAVAEQYRLSPLVTKTRELIRQGLLGRPILVHAGMAARYEPAEAWKNASETMGGGVLLDVGIHYVNVLRFWFGEPELVWAVTPTHLNEHFEGEDSALAVLRFPGGVVSDLRLTWSGIGSPAHPNFEIVGEKGALELWFDRSSLRVTAPLADRHWAKRANEILPWRVRRRIAGWLPTNRRTHYHVSGDDLIGSDALLENFLQAITGGQAPATTGVDGLRDLQVIQAAYQSLKTGDSVTLSLAE